MRWIAISLVVINLAVAGWYLWQPSASPEEAALQAEGGLPELTYGNLRTERGSDALDIPTLTTLDNGSSDDPQCAFIGVFADEDNAQTAQRRLAALEIQSEVSVVEVPDEPLWWVHLEPASTSADAERRLRQLNERQIDSFLVSQGEFRNAISLGYFRSRDNALTLRDQLQSSDVDAQLREIQRFRDTYWLTIQPEHAAMMGEGSLSNIRAAQPDIEMREAACGWLQNA